eukprot:TRINITY_DN6171_c0_g2_i1.p1 TRINITY_DN6171_c0_g2~~TRINITY_DN6171_c0_g2_i1.p1  ORF type:complete len:468 (+),score=76.89 TRINITY_DN6171_c0_g2_i1:139-1542(+)
MARAFTDQWILVHSALLGISVAGFIICGGEISDITNDWWSAWRSGFIWTAITLCVVTGNTVGGSLAKSMQRIAGTVLGGGVSMLAYWAYPNLYWMACWCGLFVFIAFNIGLSNPSIDYACRLGGLTTLLVAEGSYSSNNQLGFQLGCARIGGICLGVVTGLLIVLAYPSTATQKIDKALLDAVRKLRAAVRGSMERLAPECAPLCETVLEEEDVSMVIAAMAALGPTIQQAANELPVGASCFVPCPQRGLDPTNTVEIASTIKQLTYAVQAMSEACTQENTEGFYKYMMSVHTNQKQIESVARACFDAFSQLEAGLSNHILLPDSLGGISHAAGLLMSLHEQVHIRLFGVVTQQLEGTAEGVPESISLENLSKAKEAPYELKLRFYSLLLSLSKAEVQLKKLEGLLQVYLSRWEIPVNVGQLSQRSSERIVDVGCDGEDGVKLWSETGGSSSAEVAISVENEHAVVE